MKNTRLRRYLSTLIAAVVALSAISCYVYANESAGLFDKEYTDEYLRRWQMYNMLQLIGDPDLAKQYVEDPENFPWPVLNDQSVVPAAA